MPTVSPELIVKLIFSRTGSPVLSGYLKDTFLNSILPLSIPEVIAFSGSVISISVAKISPILSAEAPPLEIITNTILTIINDIKICVR